MKTIFIIIAAVILGFNLSQANATESCSMDSTINATMYFGSVAVPMDAPVGAVIATVAQTAQASLWAYSTTGQKSCDADLKFVYLGSVLSGITGVYNTNLPGVGIKVDGIPNKLTVTSSGANIKTYVYPTGYNISLIKTGPITPGTLTAGPLATGQFGDPTVSNFLNLSLGAGNNSVIVIGCSLQTPTLNFQMGSVSTSSFGTTAGRPLTETQQSQTLGLNCDFAVNINVSLTGIQNPDVSDTSVLALTGQGNNDVAQGVGVQILYNGSPLQLNNQIVLKQSFGGVETFPIIARYYQTKTAVTTGSANASATLTITYQ
ncbi:MULTISPECIES: fimbrial protein [Enterobacterales]|uniref:fimbrial protein n=1 Tax=Enterobacterales TaxID=91347 RepID=UPI002EDB0D68